MKNKKEIIILSYNVRNCRGLDNKTDYKRIADIINNIGPDYVAIQELDSATQRSNGEVVLNELAKRTNMHSVYSASISFQGGKYGVGILSKEIPRQWRSMALPGKEEKRSLLIAEFNNLVFCCTHFSLTKEDRLKSVGITNEIVQDSGKPIILAGDLNAVAGSEEINNLEKEWLMLNNPDIPTIPADAPLKCIDYIFIRNVKKDDIKLIQSVVEKESVASDHLPVWVKLRFKK